MKTASLILLLPLLAAIVLASAACGDTCTSTCETHNQCAGAFHQECAAVCNAAVAEASHTGCEATYNTLQTCIASPPAPATVCTDDPGARCSTQQTAYDECRATYCSMHGDGGVDPYCRVP